MKEYEIIIETINPCGGTKHAQNEIIEAEAESPEAYVKEHGILPVMDVSKNTSGDVIPPMNYWWMFLLSGFHLSGCCQNLKTY